MYCIMGFKTNGWERKRKKVVGLFVNPMHMLRSYKTNSPRRYGAIVQSNSGLFSLEGPFISILFGYEPQHSGFANISPFIQSMLASFKLLTTCTPFKYRYS